MALDRKLFFTTIRKLDKTLTLSQVAGFNGILDVWEQTYAKLYPKAYLAYMLATAWHETATTMQPIAEFGKGKGRAYGIADKKTGKVYYGRGFVQLTWLKNYLLAGTKLGVDLVNNPELALDLRIATRIMFEGMLNGWFTGKRLADYRLANGSFQKVNARRIINGTDKAVLIAGYFDVFLAALG